MQKLLMGLKGKGKAENRDEYYHGRKTKEEIIAQRGIPKEELQLIDDFLDKFIYISDG